MRRPLLPPALGFAAGIAVAGVFGFPEAAAAILAAAALILGVALPRVGPAWLTAGFFAAGALAHRWATEPLSPADLRRLTPSPPQIVTLRAIIAETPEFRLPEVHGAPAGRTMVRLEVRARRTADGWEPARGLVAASTAGALPAGFFRTREVEVDGVLDRPPGPAARGLFDYRGFLESQGVWYSLKCDGPQDWRLAGDGPATPPWSERFLPWARAALARGLPDDPAAGLFAAMALGWKTPLTETVDDPFLRSGTLHVFAVSGLHIALVAWMFAQVLQLARVPKAAAGVAALPWTWFYVAATGWQASAIRAGVMSTALLAGAALRRPSDLLNSLSGAALAVLVWRPGQLFQAGFQLSFIAVAGIGLLAAPIRNWLRARIAGPNAAYIPLQLRRRPPWAEALLGWLADSLALGLAALVSTLPLTIHWFHVVSVISLAANLAVVPLSTAALAAALASLLTGAVWPWLGTVFNAAGWALLQGMIGASRAGAGVPGGHWFVEAPPWWWWTPFYLAAAVAGSGWLRTRLRRRRAAATALAVAAAAGVAWRRHAASVRWTVLAGGEAALVCGAGNHLLDAGDTNAATRLIVPLLRARGVNGLDSLIVTRADVRHAAGAGGVVDGLPVDLIAGPAGAQRWPGGRALQAAMAARRRTVVDLAAGSSAPPWRALAPAGPSGAAADESSLALTASLRGVDVLWIGALGRSAQRRLAAQGLGRTDVVIAGEPPDGLPWLDPLWDSLRPRLVILTAGRRPGSHHLTPEMQAAWRERGVPVIFTGESGAVELTLRHGAWRAAAMDGSTWSSPP